METDDIKRLGRAIVFVHQHDHKIVDHLARAEVEVLLLTGRAMDFATRLKGHRSIVPINQELAVRYAKYAGLGPLELMNTILPALKKADLLDYTIKNDAIDRIEEYIGVSATIVEQTVTLLNTLGPKRTDLALLHSVEIGAIAPLSKSQHLEEIKKRGYTDVEAEDALRLARAVGLNLQAPSAELNEAVIYSPYVWGTRQLSLAKFIANLPPNERDALLGMSEQILNTPGLHISKLSAPPSVIASAQSAGLIQAAGVMSRTGAQSTYVFSPLLEVEDDVCNTTEALHLRKLFVAHILFGSQQAPWTYGRIQDPAVLVRSLINRGRIGPATAIGTDYYLLEAAGVVAVEPGAGDRAFLRLVKRDIAESGLAWIERITDPAGPNAASIGEQASKFVTPEDSRARVTDGAANELMIASVNELRKEMQRAARRDDPWS